LEAGRFFYFRLYIAGAAMENLLSTGAQFVYSLRIFFTSTVDVSTFKNAFYVGSCHTLSQLEILVQAGQYGAVISISS
jgi:hypothetical protein